MVDLKILGPPVFTYTCTLLPMHQHKAYTSTVKLLYSGHHKFLPVTEGCPYLRGFSQMLFKLVYSLKKLHCRPKQAQ